MEKLKNRKEDILRFLQPYMEECFQKSCQLMQTDIEKHGTEIWFRLRDTLNEVLQVSEDAQTRQQKGPIQYLVISFLRSGIYMDKLTFYLESLDDSFYLDHQETARIFEMTFLQKQFMDDVSFLHKKVKEKFIRLQNYELLEIREEYAFFYYSIVFEMLKHLSELMVHEIERSNVKITDQFKILYGEYLETSTVVYPKE